MMTARAEHDIDDLAARYRTLLRQRWPHGHPTLEQIEALAEVSRPVEKWFSRTFDSVGEFGSLFGQEPVGVQQEFRLLVS